jgi:hypothetical protein
MVFMKRLQQKDTSRRTTALLAAGFLLNVGIMAKAMAEGGGANQYEYCYQKYCSLESPPATLTAQCIIEGCKKLHPPETAPIHYLQCLDNALAEHYKPQPLCEATHTA